MSVGYDLYLKLLEEAVLEERGEEKRIETECAADLTVNAHIPDRYVPSAEQRMDLYRRIAAIRTDEDASDLLDEMLTLRRGAQVRSGLLDVACCVLPRPKPACPISPRRAASCGCSWECSTHRPWWRCAATPSTASG